MHPDSIKISAILPNYNSSEFLARSIQSLVEQMESFTEIIIIDDGSTDESLSVIDEFMKKYKHIRLIQHKKNEGVCSALNHGLKQAVGDYVLMCAANDWYPKESVMQVKQVLRQYPSVGLICGDAAISYYNKQSVMQKMLPYTKNTFISAEKFKKIARNRHVFFHGGGIFINRQAIIATDFLQPELRWHCDWLLYFIIAFQHGIYYQDSIFVYITRHKKNYSDGIRNWKMQKQVIISLYELLNQKYLEICNDFKESAILPYYTPHYIFLFLRNPILRQFLTLKLCWKLLIRNAIVVWMSKLFSYRVVLKIKQLIKA